MKNDLYRRSRLARSSWISIAVFFVLFCSCPVKRYIKLELYKHSAPIECPYDGNVICKQIKDGNLIDKSCKVEVVSIICEHGGEPGTTPGFQLVSLLHTDAFITLFLQSSIGTYHGPAPHTAIAFEDPLPRYLECRKLQV